MRVGAVSRWWVLAVLCASLLLVAMDATILNVALPSLIDDLRPDAIQQLWIIDVYGLILGGLLVTMGAAGDRWGRKRMFLIGFVLFGVASAVSATAVNPWNLVGGRVLLGIGGAMVMPSTLSLIRVVFTDARERARAIAIWAAVAGVGAAIGPVLGGLLVEHYGWAAAFWVNVPVVVVTVVAGVFLLPESRQPSESALDWFGAAISVVGMIALAWGIKHLPTQGLLSSAPLIMLAGIVLLIVFGRRQLRQDDPLLDVRLFANRAFLAAAVAILFAMMAAGTVLYLSSLWLQYVLGVSPLAAGVRMVPLAAATLVGALAAPRIARLLGTRTAIALSLGLATVGFVLLALAPINYPVIALVFVAMGLADGVGVTSATTVMISAAPPHRAGGAAAVEETCYELGVGFGVALLGSVAAAVYRGQMDAAPITATVPESARESVGGATEVARELPPPAGPTLLATAHDAYLHAVAITAAVSGVLTLVAAILVLMLVPRGFQATAGH